MKLTHLAAVLAAASMMAPVAHASKSRLGALETGGVGGTDGSVFIKDTRNVFLNPAFVSQFGKNINMEFGSNGSGTTTEPRAEGGFMLAGDNMSYGVQLGRSGFANQNLLGTVTTLSNFGTTFDSGTANIYAQESIEIMVAGQGGWGVALHYASSSDDNGAGADSTSGNEVNQTADVITVKGGYLTDKINVFAHFDVTHESVSEEQDNSGNDETLEGQFTWRLGGSYMLDDDSSIGGLISMGGVDATIDTGTETTTEVATTTARIEYFRNMVKEEKMMAYYKAGVSYSDASADTSGTEVTINTLAIPVTVGVETKMEEWLTFRGSVTQNIILNQNTTDNSSEERAQENIGTTTVAAGVGMAWGGLTIDSQLAATASPTQQATGTNGDNSGRIDGDNLLARVGVNYSF